tara:strand:+ start:10108 stop:11142 length:1035 start_codon:yes stop_codon:yes gene_type:complete
MYFSKFPLINYRNLTSAEKDGTRKIARDIVRRIAFSKRLKDEASLYQDYYIPEGERPEHTALKVYGNEEYHWVVLLFNDITNPYYDWPLDGYALENYIDKKYPGEVLYCSKATVVKGTATDNEDFSGLTHAANETVFQWQGTKDDFGVPVLDSTTRALVWKHNPSLGALEIINKEGDFEVGKYVLKIISPEEYQFSKIEKIKPNKVGLHHFEIEGATAGEEVWQDGLSNLEGIPIGQTGAGPTNGVKTVGGTGSGANSETAVQFTDTYLAKYMGCGASNEGTDNNSVANDIYEITKNDRARTIKLLDPRYLDLVLTEFEVAIKKGSTRTIFNAPVGNTKQSRSY